MSQKYLIWGGTGWIGSMLYKLLLSQNKDVSIAKSRLQDFPVICAELDMYKPKYVLHVAGITGKPNVDWCEDNKQVTLFLNTGGTMNLVHACWERNIHVTYYSSGCIYAYHGTNYNFSFRETDEPNFSGSLYSQSKIYTEKLLQHYNNVLILRLRLPVSGDDNNKDLINKLIRYKKVVNIPNSISILPELLPISIKMMESGETGIYNFTNPGTISHTEILSLYKKYRNPDFAWEIFSLEEQQLTMKAQRSNCHLDTKKLTSLYYVTPVHESLELLFKLNESK
jgi:nucleoside-diphosphate-sugar epimerase